jgi:hypothetical protein
VPVRVKKMRQIKTLASGIMASPNLIQRSFELAAGI